jgi:hypothetical protein
VDETSLSPSSKKYIKEPAVRALQILELFPLNKVIDFPAAIWPIKHSL